MCDWQANVPDCNIGRSGEQEDFSKTVGNVSQSTDDSSEEAGNSSEETGDSSEETGDSSEETGDSSEENTDRVICVGVDDCPAENPALPMNLPHPTDPTKFCQCDWGVPIEMNCPEGLHWNQNATPNPMLSVNDILDLLDVEAGDVEVSDAELITNVNTTMMLILMWKETNRALAGNQRVVVVAVATNARDLQTDVSLVLW
ncbi:unnamed protein product [Cyprideis torosa]|uniref:Uncharacterized protein n=1 Tax=Cyprideis torosa TaxID=163714 RepID=A0A7R8ZIT9_9CRUS|nr:unnamed protein product [Cyprideis torosa]CAG0880728.1 unnamed protein product [Cyprideis torosa]